jgi:hypothetical protein
VISGLNDYSKVTSKTTNVQLTQLAADILAIVAQGEKSVSAQLISLTNRAV